MSTGTLRKPPRFQLTPPVVREHPLQEQMTKVLTIEIAPPGRVRRGAMWYSVDHAAYSGEVPGARIGRGIIAGIPDTFLIYRGRAHYVEVKAADGQLSEHQKEVATAILLGGGLVGIATTVDELLICVDAWNIPRAHRINPPF